MILDGFRLAEGVARPDALAPGAILTSALDTVASNDELRAPTEKLTPMRRPGEAADDDAAAIYLASPAGSYLTGNTPEVNGGLTCAHLDTPRPTREPRPPEEQSCQYPSSNSAPATSAYTR